MWMGAVDEGVANWQQCFITELARLQDAGNNEKVNSQIKNLRWFPCEPF